jgi:hypothetical protein
MTSQRTDLVEKRRVRAARPKPTSTRTFMREALRNNILLIEGRVVTHSGHLACPDNHKHIETPIFTFINYFAK